MKQIKKEDLISFLLAKYPTKEEEVAVLQPTDVRKSIIERYQPQENKNINQDIQSNGKYIMWILGIVVLALIIFILLRRKKEY